MDVMEAIRNRSSVRKYRREEMPDEDLHELLEAARRAPSGANRQPWQLIVVRDQGTKDRLVPLCRDQEFVRDCSAFLAGVNDPGQRWAKMDLAIALDHLSLAAVEKGLGTCWVGAFDAAGVSELLQVPPGLELTVCMALGYPAEEPARTGRKPLKELVHFESYGGRT
ncbi:MAG: nitroreductase family protein [Methanomassiliicoccales archaeon]